MTPFTDWDDPTAWSSYRAEIADARAEAERHADLRPTAEDLRDEPTRRVDPASGADGWKCRCGLDVLHAEECAL